MLRFQRKDFVFTTPISKILSSARGWFLTILLHHLDILANCFEFRKSLYGLMSSDMKLSSLVVFIRFTILCKSIVLGYSRRIEIVKVVKMKK